MVLYCSAIWAGNREPLWLLLDRFGWIGLKMAWFETGSRFVR
jgi:hypothetical protein